MYKVILSKLELQLWTFYIINTLKNSNIAQSCFLVSRVVEEFSWPKEAAGMHQNGMRAQNTFRGIANSCVPSNIKTQINPARELWGIAVEPLDKFLSFSTNHKGKKTKQFD